MKTLLTTMLLFLGTPKSNHYQFNAWLPSTLKPTYVYICDSKTAHVYHAIKDCKGLDACTHEIKKITLDDAKNKYERRACKVCE